MTLYVKPPITIKHEIPKNNAQPDFFFPHQERERGFETDHDRKKTPLLLIDGERSFCILRPLKKCMGKKWHQWWD